MPLRAPLARLQDSPIFNFSLASRELFHSNFLAWLFEQREFEVIVSEVLKRADPTIGASFCLRSGTAKSVHREKQNIDLWLTLRPFEEDDTEWHVLIENKIKSLPRLEQLEEYASKAPENSSCILMSLSEPRFALGKWKWLSYTKVLELVKKCTGVSSSSYTQLILEDYARLIEALLWIEDQSTVELSSSFDFWSPKRDDLLVELTSLRLDDFYTKKKYEALAYHIWNTLKRAKLPTAGFREKVAWQGVEPMIFVNSGMTRATGYVDLKFVIGPDFSVGVQLQGNSYRKVIEDNSGNRTVAIANQVFEGTNWFDSAPLRGDSTTYPKNKRFNRFGEVFLYRSAHLPEGCVIEDILIHCVKDMQWVLEHREQLCALSN